jgi:hypothetical protein
MGSVLNIAGPEYDFGSVVFAVLQECEHRRRGFDRDELEFQLMNTAKTKLAKIKKAYDEFGGSPAYWQSLETEVLQTAMPQYIDAAEEMNDLERAKFGVWRGADPVARMTFAGIGFAIGIIIILIPFIPIVEIAFAIALAALGFFYPEMKRYTHERRHFRLLNRLVADAVRYQSNARLHYMTTQDIRDSFAIGGSSNSESEKPKELTE